MVSVSDRCRVVAGERDIVGSYVYLIYDMADQSVDVFERPHLAFEVCIMPRYVGGFYVHYDEVLVLGPFYHGFCFGFIICLYAASCSSDINYVDTCGTGDSLDHSCSRDAGAA